MKRKDNVFADVMVGGIESNTFDLGHENKFTFQMGRLIPTCVMECVPGDRFNLNYVNFLRMMPMIAPVMHRVRVTTDYFFVPNRILADSWEDFITGTQALEAPFVLIDDVVEKGSVADYLGIPPGDYSDNPINVSAYQLAAYLRIYDDWYRDQNFCPEESVELVPGDNTSTVFGKLTGKPLKRAWEHDYFTSALPTTQQGSDVELPLVVQDNVPVDFLPGAGHNPTLVVPTTGALVGTGDVVNSVGPVPFANSLHVDGNPAAIDPNGSLVVDIQAEAATINDLREAFSLQAFLERTIRGGARYVEQMWSHFRQKSPDARLQRAELIGRKVQQVTIGEVLATAETTAAGVSVGSMAGHGISVGGGESMSYSCSEHGFIIGIMSVLPDTSYQDGLPKMFSRFDRLSYLWPSFANLGEQPIKNKEVLCHDTNSADYDLEGTFGYMPQYSEYRYLPSRVAGDFRDTLNFWTLGRIFDPNNPPALNRQFIEADPSTRIFAVTSESDDHMLAQVIMNHTVNRKLPRYGVPSTL